MEKRDILFIIGPGGAGKTTTGALVAQVLWYDFIDLDEKCAERIGNITQYVRTKWYEPYTKENEKVFNELISEISQQIVIVLSGGFIGYYPYEKLQQLGVCMVLTPHEDEEESVKTILQRQSSRDFFIDMSDEEKRSRRRIKLYQWKWDITIYGRDKTPQSIAEEMRVAYEAFIARLE